MYLFLRKPPLNKIMPFVKMVFYRILPFKKLSNVRYFIFSYEFNFSNMAIRQKEKKCFKLSHAIKFNIIQSNN